MYDKAAFDNLVNPKEAVRLAEYRTIKDIYIATDIAMEYKKSGIVPELTWLFGTIWNAGRIQGIREERSKRKSDNKNSTTNRV